MDFMNEIDGYLTLKQAAEMLNLTAQRTGQLVTERGVPVKRVGAARLIPASVIDGLRVRNKVGHPVKKDRADITANGKVSRPEAEQHAPTVPAIDITPVTTPHVDHDHYCDTCGRTIRVYKDARLNNPCGMRGCKGSVLCRERE